MYLLFRGVRGQLMYTNEHNQLTSLPSDIPPNVAVLNLGQNNLTQILNMDLHQFTGLQEINLAYNKIVTVQSGFVNSTIHPGLEVVSLVDNCIEVMPVLHEFGMLKTSTLSKNKLQTITLGKLDSLVGLILSENNMTVMPESTHLLPSLETLDLFQTPVSNIPDGYFTKTPALKKLKLQQTVIYTFDCSGFLNLQHLNLDRTNVREFPKITDCFTSLTLFRMQRNYNKLTTPGINKTNVFGSSLEPRISNSLLSLYIRDTYIGDIPSWFLFALPNLRIMDLANTRLTEMPDISTNYEYEHIIGVCLQDL